MASINDGDRPITRTFRVLEEQRSALLERLDRVPPELLVRSPSEGAWSIAQVIGHLVQAEEGALAYLRKKLKYGGLERIGAIGRFRLVLLRTAFFLPIRWKAPAIISTIPEYTWQEATDRWSMVRGELGAQLGDLPGSMADKGLFKHPSAGKMNLVQGLRFIGSHVRHHEGQIERTLSMLKKQGNDPVSPRSTRHEH